MYHGLNNSFLYSAHKIRVDFHDELGNGQQRNGTCFYVENNEGILCLVTNRHMLDASYKIPAEESTRYHVSSINITGKLGNSDDIPEVTVSFNIIPAFKFSRDENNDIACIPDPRLENGQPAPSSYVIPYDFLANDDDFQNKLMVCDFLAFPGFPEWYDRSAERPILRTGTIASDPRFDYSYGENVKGACVAYEAFSYSGSSGSPIFAVQKGPEPGRGISFPGFRRLLMVGINAGHLRISSDGYHSGISYFYKSTAIAELINS